MRPSRNRGTRMRNSSSRLYSPRKKASSKSQISFYLRMKVLTLSIRHVNTIVFMRLFMQCIYVFMSLPRPGMIIHFFASAIFPSTGKDHIT